MVTSLTRADLSKLEYPCKLEWDDGSNKFEVNFYAPREGRVTRGCHNYPIGYYCSSWNFTQYHRWHLLEVPYDPLQNGDTEDDI